MTFLHFWAQKFIYSVQNAFHLWWPPTWSILDQVRSIWAIWWPFQGPKGQIQDYFEPQNGLFAQEMALWELPKGTPKVQKWVIDTCFVNIGQLDHYVVFGTPSGAIQDIRMGKNCSVGAKQTPVWLPWPPHRPPKTLSNPLNPFSVLPFNLNNPSSYLTTQ